MPTHPVVYLHRSQPQHNQARTARRYDDSLAPLRSRRSSSVRSSWICRVNVPSSWRGRSCTYCVRHEREGTGRTWAARARRHLVLLYSDRGAWGRAESRWRSRTSDKQPHVLRPAWTGLMDLRRGRRDDRSIRPIATLVSGVVEPCHVLSPCLHVTRTHVHVHVSRGGPGGQSVSTKAGRPQCHDFRGRSSAARRGGNYNYGAGGAGQQAAART